jgi:hypothetical protein
MFRKRQANYFFFFAAFFLEAFFAAFLGAFFFEAFFAVAMFFRILMVSKTFNDSKIINFLQLSKFFFHRKNFRPLPQLAEY